MGFAEDQFYEVLGRTAPGMPDLLKVFVEKASALGVYAEFLGGLNLKHPLAERQSAKYGNST